MKGNIYRAKRIDDNLIVEGVYNINTMIGRAYPHEIFFENKWHEIDPSTLEIVQLDLNDTQKEILISFAKDKLNELNRTIDYIQYICGSDLTNIGMKNALELHCTNSFEECFKYLKESRELLKGVI